MLRGVVGRRENADCCLHSDAAVGQDPLQKGKGHLQTIGEKPSSMSQDVCVLLVASIETMLHEVR